MGARQAIGSQSDRRRLSMYTIRTELALFRSYRIPTRSILLQSGQAGVPGSALRRIFIM